MDVSNKQLEMASESIKVAITVLVAIMGIPSVLYFGLQTILSPQAANTTAIVGSLILVPVVLYSVYKLMVQV